MASAIYAQNVCDDDDINSFIFQTVFCNSYTIVLPALPEFVLQDNTMNSVLNYQIHFVDDRK